MEEKRKKQIEAYIDAYNRFDIEGMTEHLHQDVVFENISDGIVNLRTEGILVFREQAIKAKDYFRERQQKIVDWEIEGETIRISIDYHAILAMDFPNGMKAGDTLQMKGSSLFEFQDGKIRSLKDET